MDSVLQKQSLDSLHGVEMFLGNSYKLKYHFPRKVKSSTTEAANFSVDGKTFFSRLAFFHT